MVVAGDGIAAQAVSVSLRFHYIAEVLNPAAVDFAAMFTTIVLHGGEVLENVFTQSIYHLVQFSFELRRVQIFRTSGMPCVPKLLTVVSEVYADMAFIRELR